MRLSGYLKGKSDIFISLFQLSTLIKGLRENSEISRLSTIHPRFTIPRYLVFFLKRKSETLSYFFQLNTGIKDPRKKLGDIENFELKKFSPTDLYCIISKHTYGYETTVKKGMCSLLTHFFFVGFVHLHNSESEYIEFCDMSTNIFF